MGRARSTWSSKPWAGRSDTRKRGTMFTILLILLVLFALGGGGWGYSRYGWVGISPAGAVLALLAILYFTGNLSMR